MRKIAFMTLALVLCLAVGAFAGWSYARTQAKAAAATAELGHQLAVTALCAHGLNLLAGEGDPGAAARLLELRLAAALRATDQLTQQGATVAEPIPDLKDGLRRAWEYYRHRNPNAELAGAAEAVMRRLDADPATPGAPVQ